MNTNFMLLLLAIFIVVMLALACIIYKLTIKMERLEENLREFKKSEACTDEIIYRNLEALVERRNK